MGSEPVTSRRHPLLLEGVLGALALAAAACAPPPRHLVLVVLDTLRADRLAIYGHTAATTPFLTGRASELVRFAEAKAPAPWTLPSHASLFTGLPPAEHGADWGHMLLADEFTTVAETLQGAGFCTVGISANPMVGKASGLGQGFETFTIVPTPWTTKTERALAEVPAALEEARASDCRLFLFVNLMDTHIPYQTKAHGDEFAVEGPGPVRNAAVKWAVSAGRQTLSETEKAHHQRAYDAAVRGLDDALRRLVEHLAGRGDLDRTLLVITSDHGEGLGTHRELGHEISVWEEQLHVPLLVRFPHGRRGGTTIGGPRSLVALAPSLLDWLGVDRPPELRGAAGIEEVQKVTADYRSYFAERHRHTNRSIRERYPELIERVRHAHVLYCPPHKLVARADGTLELFDLDVDPGEQQSIAETAPDVLRRCARRYHELAAGGRLTPFDVTPPMLPVAAGVDDATLRSLGYVD